MQVSGGDPKRRAAVSDINITPLVDVLLVLLIIFMVTAPMIHHGAKLNTPDVTPNPAQSPPPQEDQKATLKLDLQGNLKLREQPYKREELLNILKQDPQLQREKELYIDAHPDIPYGQVMAIIGLIRKAGIKKIGVVVQPDDLK